MIELVDLADIRFWGGNPNRHPPRQLAALGEAIARFGFVTPITLVRYRGSEGLELRAGEGRVLAVKARLEEDPGFCPPNMPRAGVVPAVILDLESRDAADAYGVADERIADLAEFDLDAARLVLEGFAEADLAALEALALDDLLVPDEDEPTATTHDKKLDKTTVSLHIRMPGGSEVLHAALTRARRCWPGLGTADLLLKVLERFNEA